MERAEFDSLKSKGNEGDRKLLKEGIPKRISSALLFCFQNEDKNGRVIETLVFIPKVEFRVM